MTLIEKSKLLVSESSFESPSWKAISFVVGAVTGYTAGYWVGTHAHPRCVSTEVIKALENDDSCRVIQNDVYRSFLLDMWVVIDDDTKAPIPLVNALKTIDTYSQQHPEQDLNFLLAGFHGIYPILLDQAARKDWNSDSQSFETAATVREKIERYFTNSGPQILSAFRAQKSVRIVKTYDLIHDAKFIETYRRRAAGLT